MTRNCRTGLFFAAAAILGSGLGSGPAAAGALDFAPIVWTSGETELRLGGYAVGAAYLRGGQDVGIDDNGATAQARVSLRLQHMYDTGVVAGARVVALAYHDELSGDRYGNDVLEKAFVFVQMGYGTLEIGQQDGVAAQLSAVGPKVIEQISIDDPQTTFFFDPSTGRRFDDAFRLIAANTASANAGKINYLSPRLFGVRVGASFTPQMTKAGLPFLGNPSDAPNGQENIWEVAASYFGNFGDLALNAYASFAQGSLRNPTPGFDDLHDWGFGVEVRYALNDAELALGGGYRITNAYALAIGRAYDGNETHVAHVSAMVTTGPWQLGAEYSDGQADGPAGIGDLHFKGTQLTAAYTVSNNLLAAAGWQWFDDTRSVGAFYDGTQALKMDAGFLSLRLSI